MSNSYEPNPPDSPGARAEGKWEGIVGLTLNLGPIVGTVVAAWRLLPGLLEYKETGEVTEEIAEYVRQALLSSGLGILAGLIGLGIVFHALLVPKLREPWFFVCAMIAAGLWCFVMFPLGLLPGIFLFLLFLPRREEFYPRLG